MVEFTLPALGVVRGEILGPAPMTDWWRVLGSDGEVYAVCDADLVRLTGRAARRVKSATGVLLAFRWVQAMLADESNPTPRPRTTTPAPSRRVSGYSTRPADEPAGVPYALHDLDAPTPVGPDWTPQFTAYMSAATGAYVAGLHELTDRDPRLRTVYHVCVEGGHSSDDLAVHLGISGAHVRRLRREAVTIMGDRRESRT